MVVIVLLIGLRMLGILPYAVKPPSNATTEEEAKTAYDLALSPDITYQDIIGFSLPETASDMYAHIDFSVPAWNGFVVAHLPEGELRDLLDKLKVSEKPDLLENWPDALDCNPSDFKDRYWDISDLTNKATYYFEHPEEVTRLFLVYDNGKLYFKKETQYHGYQIIPGGEILYKKARRDQQVQTIQE